jgi:hypothetical protein
MTTQSIEHKSDYVAEYSVFADLPAGAHRFNTGDWFFKWNCENCRDSGLFKSLLGIEQCSECRAFESPISQRVFGAICVLTLKEKPVDDLLFKLACALVPATAEHPLPGDALLSLLVLSARDLKGLAKRLRDEWRIAVIGSRQPPYGYFIASTAEEFLAWGRVTRSQAISELATYYGLFKANFPELAGQQSLDFVNTVSAELQEAIR